MCFLLNMYKKKQMIYFKFVCEDLKLKINDTTQQEDVNITVRLFAFHMWVTGLVD